MKIRNLNFTSLITLLTLAACSSASKETKIAPSAFVVPSQFSQFHPRKAPEPAGPVLQKGDRLAICGDSITEQKMYSRIMETYLTVAQPDLAISVRQFGWSGETAEGFLARMTNDCLRFNPTVATTNYAIAGGDGVHPDWAGHLVMAYAFLHSFGLGGEIGTFTIDLRAGKAKASAGHEVLSFSNGALQIKSTRYPFCATGDPKNHNRIRSGMTLAPFNQELNRFRLVVKNGKEKSYIIAWGTETKIYSAEQLEKGVNLAEDFPGNPFLEAFKKVDEAVKAKQAYETKQIQQFFHGDEGKKDMEATAAKTEKERDKLAAEIKKAFLPVTHVIRIEAN